MTGSEAGQTSKRDGVRTRVLTLLLDGRYRPGERLNLSRLTRDLGVSATPVREALTQLELEGLVSSEPNRGFFVTDLSPRRLQESYAILGALEAFAVRSTTRVPAGAVRRLESINKTLARRKLSAMDALRADRSWHELLVAHCENQTLVEEIARHRRQVAVFELSYMDLSPDRAQSHRDHDRIEQSIRATKFDVGAQQIEEHWKRSVRFHRERG